MKHISDIILKSLLTEKSTKFELSINTVSFIVDRNATKTMIKKGFSKLFNCEVISVNTMNVMKKTRRNRKTGQKILGKVVKKALVRFKDMESVVDQIAKMGKGFFQGTVESKENTKTAKNEKVKKESKKEQNNTSKDSRGDKK